MKWIGAGLQMKLADYAIKTLRSEMEQDKVTWIFHCQFWPLIIVWGIAGSVTQFLGMNDMANIGLVTMRSFMNRLSQEAENLLQDIHNPDVQKHAEAKLALVRSTNGDQQQDAFKELQEIASEESKRLISHVTVKILRFHAN